MKIIGSLFLAEESVPSTELHGLFLVGGVPPHLLGLTFLFWVVLGLHETLLRL